MFELLQPLFAVVVLVDALLGEVDDAAMLMVSFEVFWLLMEPADPLVDLVHSVVSINIMHLHLTDVSLASTTLLQPVDVSDAESVWLHVEKTGVPAVRSIVIVDNDVGGDGTKPSPHFVLQMLLPTSWLW